MQKKCFLIAILTRVTMCISCADITELFNQIAIDYLENKINHLESLDDIVNVSILLLFFYKYND